MAVRNQEQGETAIEQLRKDTGKTAILLKLDLVNLKSVKGAAEEFLRWIHCVIVVHRCINLTVRCGQQGERIACPL